MRTSRVLVVTRLMLRQYTPTSHRAAPATNSDVLFALRSKRLRIELASVTPVTMRLRSWRVLPVTRQVSAPSPLNHHASMRAFSCASCHNGKRAFGGDDFSVCKRCHKGSAWHF